VRTAAVAVRKLLPAGEGWWHEADDLHLKVDLVTSLEYGPKPSISRPWRDKRTSQPVARCPSDCQRHHCTEPWFAPTTPHGLQPQMRRGIASPLCAASGFVAAL